MLGQKTLAVVSAANLNLRRVSTLRKMFSDLNENRWPAVFGGVVEEYRLEIMNEIAHELGMRIILKKTVEK